MTDQSSGWKDIRVYWDYGVRELALAADCAKKKGEAPNAAQRPEFQ